MNETQICNDNKRTPNLIFHGYRSLRLNLGINIGVTSVLVIWIVACYKFHWQTEVYLYLVKYLECVDTCYRKLSIANERVFLVHSLDAFMAMATKWYAILSKISQNRVCRPSRYVGASKITMTVPKWDTKNINSVCILHVYHMSYGRHPSHLITMMICTGCFTVGWTYWWCLFHLQTVYDL